MRLFNTTQLAISLLSKSSMSVDIHNCHSSRLSSYIKIISTFVLLTFPI